VVTVNVAAKIKDYQSKQAKKAIYKNNNEYNLCRPRSGEKIS